MQEKRSLDLKTKISTLLTFTFLYYVVRNVSITPNIIQDGGILQDNLATFTGMQFDKISLFSLGVTPYMLSVMVLNLMKIDILPDIKAFLENPANKNKVKKIEYAIFLFYCGLQIWMLYGFLTFFEKVILFIGAIVLRKIADKITNLNLINGISYILALSILAEIFNDVAKNPIMGTASLLIALLLSFIYVKSGYNIIIETYTKPSHSFGTDVSIPISLPGVGPLFYSSIILSITQFIFETYKIQNSLVLNLVYVLFIYFFTFKTYFKVFEPTQYTNTLLQYGYAVNDGSKIISDPRKYIKTTLSKAAFISASSLCLFSFAPAIIKFMFHFEIPISMISVVLFVSIVTNLMNALVFYGIKTDYELLAYDTANLSKM